MLCFISFKPSFLSAETGLKDEKDFSFSEGLLIEVEEKELFNYFITIEKGK